MAKDPMKGPDPSDENDDQPNPLSQLFEMLGLGGAQTGDLTAFMAQLQNAFTQMGGLMPPAAASASGVNWTFTKDVARKTVAALGADPTPSSDEQRVVADAGRLADMWLSEATVFDAVSGARTAWSRADWVEGTMDVWQLLVEPIVGSIATAMSGLMNDGQEAAELAQLNLLLAPMMKRAASSMFGAQVGQALGKLGAEVLSGTDIGLPLTSKPGVHLLVTNVRTFADGLDLPERDVILYLMLRESARQRLFTDVAWLAPQLLALVEHYAREITIDRAAIEQAFDLDDISGLNPETFERLGTELAGKLFEPAKTPEQAEIVRRLENLLALVEGWVDEVTEQATANWMPNAAALAESLRRRRAAGGPAEQLLEALVGLELRPRRLRDAANLWAALRDARGVEGRDAVWKHPDLVPTAADLDDPLGFVAGDRTAAVPDDMDAALAKLLEEETGHPDE